MSTDLSKILHLDEKLKGVPLIDRGGEIKDMETRKGVKLILSPEELKNYALAVAITAGVREKWDAKLGHAKCQKEGAIVVTAEPDVSMSLVDKLASALGHTCR